MDIGNLMMGGYLKIPEWNLNNYHKGESEIYICVLKNLTPNLPCTNRFIKLVSDLRKF